MKAMRLYDRLYGLRIITFCIRGNHFHILVEVPNQPKAAFMQTDKGLVALVAEAKGNNQAFWLNYWLTHRR